MIKNAEWIGISEDFGTVCPKFIKKFKKKRGLTMATLVITAMGVYEARLNGVRVGDFILAPGCTVYGKRLQYQTYDITDMLADDNELSVTVGTGWYRGRISEKYGKTHNAPCALITEITLEYESGITETIFTDGTWRVSRSNILFSDIYDGEEYDASAEQSEKYAVKVLDLPKDTLIPQEGEIVCEHERIKPQRMIITPNGERVIDFGQNLAGYVELNIDAKRGTKIVLSHAEVLDKDGNFYTDNYRSAKARLKYICRNSKQTYKPHFTFFGFRYIRLDEYPETVNLDDFTTVALYSDMKRTGNIKCSNEKINRLFENVLWSQRSNFIDIPTDCPQRDERMGWTGDAQVFAKAASYNYDVKRFFEKWMCDVCAEQFENGAVPDTVPNFWRLKGSSAAWGDAITIIPWQMYLTYGDTAILAECFDSMKKWVDYITADTKDEFLWTCEDSQKKLWGKHYGDWLALDAPVGSYKGASDDDFIASAFYAYSTELLVNTGKVLGRDMSKYETLHSNIISAFKEHYSRPKTQTEHVLALYFNLTDEPEKIAAELNEMIIANGNRLQTGFVGTPYLLHALSNNRYTETAYSLLLQEDYPSWLYEVNHGATTIWEHWDGINDSGAFWSSDMNSYNHYAYGSVVDWIYEVAAGIKTDEVHPGFEKIIIEPHPDKRLDWLGASIDTKYGTVSSKWSHVDGGIKYEVTVASSAVIKIDGISYEVEKGTYEFIR